MKFEPLSPKDVTAISPERRHIAKIFKKYVDAAVYELGSGYDVSFQGKFDKGPIVIEIEVTSKEGIP